MARDKERSEKPRGEGPADYSPRRQIENLLDQLQAQTRRLRAIWEAGEAARLRSLAGELATAADGQGNSAISDSAAQLEAMLVAEEAEASAMCERVEALIGQCRKAATSKEK